MQYRFWRTKSRQKMINLSIFHARFKKYIISLCVGVYLDSQKSNSMQSGHHQFCIIFPNFSQKEIQLWIKIHLAFRVSTRMQNKCTSVQTGQRPCILRVFPDAGYCVFYSQKRAWDPQKIIICVLWDSQ